MCSRSRGIYDYVAVSVSQCLLLTYTILGPLSREWEIWIITKGRTCASRCRCRCMAWASQHQKNSACRVDPRPSLRGGKLHSDLRDLSIAQSNLLWGLQHFDIVSAILKGKSVVFSFRKCRPIMGNLNLAPREISWQAAAIRRPKGAGAFWIKM